MTNYCSHAIDDLRLFAKKGAGSNFSQHCANVARQIEQSQKFLFPEYGRLLDWKGLQLAEQIGTYCQPFRLPFPNICIEFSHPSCATSTNQGSVTGFDATVAIARESNETGKDAIHISCVYRTIIDGRKWWVPCNFEVALYEDGTCAVKANLDNAVTQAGVEYLGVVDRACLDLQTELQAVMQLIAALACRNVIVRKEEPRKGLVKKRARHGKTPFFSYHVLDISDQSIATASNGGSHASPRVHLRRGHIRRCPSGNVWVNACVVGNKAMGLVTKDYRLGAKEAA